MAVAFCMDVHIPMAIIRHLRLRSVNVATVTGEGANTLSEKALLQLTRAHGRVIFARDIRFKTLAENWQRTGKPFAGLIHDHAEGASIGQYVRDLELITKACEPAKLVDTVIHLPLSLIHAIRCDSHAMTLHIELPEPPARQARGLAAPEHISADALIAAALTAQFDHAPHHPTIAERAAHADRSKVDDILILARIPTAPPVEGDEKSFGIHRSGTRIRRAKYFFVYPPIACGRAGGMWNCTNAFLAFPKARSQSHRCLALRVE